MHRGYKLFITFLLFSSTACSTGYASGDETPAASLDPQPESVILTIDSTSEQIQQAMLTSATRWQTIWLDGTVTWYAPDGTAPVQVYHEQVWVDQLTNRFRILLSGVNTDLPETFRACDGSTILEMNVNNGASQSRPLPEFAHVGQYVPPVEKGVAYPNPLWGQIGTPLSEIVFSSNYAQNSGAFKVINTEMIAGRETLAVEWMYLNNPLPSFRAWLDTSTAVILKLQEFGKEGGDSIQGERLVNQVVYNKVFYATLFGTPSVSPEFGDVTGGLAPAKETEAVPPSGEDPLGHLYFFTLPHQAGRSAQLVRLPGSCVVGLSQCPQLETVSVPFPFNFNLSALAWSPDGSLAAFAYPDNAKGTPTKLWIFDPVADIWNSIAEFPYIDPPFWSPDGTWIAFRVQDGKGVEDVYAIHRNGTDLKNLTASGSLPVEGRPYVMDGWLTENIIMRSALPGTMGGVYLLRVSDGTAGSMFETLLTKATFVVSPDNAWLTYDDYDYNSQKHAIKVIEPDGANPVELVTFAGGSVYPIVWSPDGNQIAFAHSSSDANFNPISDVYRIGRDGHGITQVYNGTTVGRILFSPDSKYLLVEETTSATGGHLFVVDLETLEQKILSAPGLSLDTDWYAPSWKP